MSASGCERIIRLLVVGFGPFPGVRANPSGPLAVAVAGSRRLALRGATARALVLPTTFEAIETVLKPALAREQPDVVLMVGVAMRRRVVSLETQAVNRVSRLLVDACGALPKAIVLRPGGPAVIRSPVPVAPVLSALRSGGLAGRASRDAGRYLCNAAYFAALAQADQGRPLVVFVHVPRPRGRGRAEHRPSLATMAAGLTEVVLLLLAGARRRASVPRL